MYFFAQQFWLIFLTNCVLIIFMYLSHMKVRFLWNLASIVNIGKHESIVDDLIMGKYTFHRREAYITRVRLGALFAIKFTGSKKGTIPFSLKQVDERKSLSWAFM